MEKYKSKYEKAIAEFLKECGIKFLYEYPMLIDDVREYKRIIYPDFWLPRLNTVIEYFGMLEKPSYIEMYKLKVKTYEKLDIDLVKVRQSTFTGNWRK